MMPAIGILLLVLYYCYSFKLSGGSYSQSEKGRADRAASGLREIIAIAFYSIISI